MADHEQLNMGDIYLIKNTVNQKCYVGQAAKYTGQVNMKWGTHARWLSHLREAFTVGVKDRCTILNAALRKYGKDAFEVTTMCECHLNELNAKEDEYIQQFNSMMPNGYNLRRGGVDGKYGETKKIRSLKTHDSTTALGYSKDKNMRKYAEDAALPKYITATRDDGVVVGYRINGFPIGVEAQQYVSKSFMNKDDPTKALEDAKKGLDQLYLQHVDREDKIKAVKVAKKEAGMKRERELENDMARTKILAMATERLAEDYIKPMLNTMNKISGYVVHGLKDPTGKAIPPKVFDKNQNNHNLSQAMKYVKQVQDLIANNVGVGDWTAIDTIAKCDKKGVEEEHLPKFVNVVSYKGKKSGYVVNGYPLPGGKKSCKKFTNSFKYTMEQRYKMTIDYLKQLMLDHPIQ